MDKYYLLINTGEGFKLMTSEPMDEALLNQSIKWVKSHNEWNYKVLIEEQSV